MKKSAILILLAVSIFLVSISTTLAWFTNISYIDNDNLTASAITGYFRSGDGTADDPFVISTPRHLYNLAWLQYLGELNKVDKNGKITQYYFKLEDLDDGSRDNVIDVDGLVLPPIGTTENPFVGHFDGNGVCIKNLTVSNYLSTNTGDSGIVERPLSETTINETTTSIIGFFGVVGSVSEDMQKKLIKEDENADFRSRVNSVHDLFLENLTVRTESTTSLIGLLAGYVNGSVGNVGIGKSSIVLGKNVRPLTDSAVVKITSLISSYSLIGECNDANVFWIDVPKKTWGDSDDPNSGVGWGGSINFLELRKRIAYIVGAVGVEKVPGEFSGNNAYSVNGFGYIGRFSSYQAYIANSYEYRPSRAPFLKGTVMPISVDPTVFESTTQKTHNDKGYTQTYDTTKYYVDNLAQNAEPVLSTNSAYLVGGGSTYNDTFIRFVPEYPLGPTNKMDGAGVYKSLSEQYVSKGAFPKNDANFVMHMLTIDVKGTTYVIQDDYNVGKTSGTYFAKTNNHSYSFKTYSNLGFSKYIQKDSESGADTGVRTTFVNKNAGETLIQGICFHNKINLNNLQKTTANVTLMNQAYNNYELIDGAINFSLGEAGTMTTIAGTYNNSSFFNESGATQNLYTVLQVNRGSNNQISSVTVIKEIHEERDASGNLLRYVYNLTDDPDQKLPNCTYTMVYSKTAMSNLSEENALYYFEIPLNAGDYAIGLTTNDSQGAFLLYLDIGANGDQSIKDTTGTEATHTINGLTFVNMNNLEQITVDGKDINSTNGYKVTVFEINMPTAKDHGGLTMTYERTTNKVMTHTETDPDGAFTVQWTESDPVATQSLQLGQVILVNPKRREDSA